MKNILCGKKIFPLKDTKKGDNENEVVIVVGVVGEWHGHPDGSFKISLEDLKNIKDNFDNSRQELIVIDYEHQTLYGTEAPAAGWVHKLEIEGDKLMAYLQWTEKATEYIKKGEYKYVSPVYVFDTYDKETNAYSGITLHSVALTNTPFLDELGEVYANKKTQKEETMGKEIENNQSNEQEQTTQTPAGNQSNTDQGQNPGTNQEEQSNASSENAAPAQSNETSEVEKLKEQLAETKVDAAIAANKITGDQRSWAIKYCKADLAGFEEFLKFQKEPRQAPGNNMYPNKGEPGGNDNGFDVVKMALN